jgi:gliding motility-associated lipoprotein GldK
MKKFPFYLALLIALIILGSCSNSGNGELVGVRQKSKHFYQPDPYGMVFVPQGSFTMGTGDQDFLYSQLHQPKTVSVASYYMDETEITNNEYRQFVYWVRDSIARWMLYDNGITEPAYILTETRDGDIIDPPLVNWDEDVPWDTDDQAIKDALEDMYLPEHERYFRRKEVDTRKLFYEYYWVDLQAAARKDWTEDGNTENAAFANRPQGMRDRSVYVRKELINVYPDTLCWIHDYTYSYNDPMTKKYFHHIAFDHYPVVGVNWSQAKAFCVWRTELKNAYLRKEKNSASVAEFRLPTETEWEWAARGGYENSPFPWGGPYIRNDKGCILANYKPIRGNYIADGGLRTVIVAHYPPNRWGLYDMSGNVAEWTISAFDPASYNFTWDMNPNYTYNAKVDDPPAMKRKVVKGGSWKDVAYYLQVQHRAYEYQDTAKSYIGFRTVQPFLGRNKDDNPAKASRVYN